MRAKGQRIEDSGFDEFCVWHAHHTEEKGSRYKNPIVFQNGEFRDDTEGRYGEDIFLRLHHRLHRQEEGR